ncbi:MAG TPA: hypothetical protein VGI85_12805 [Chthoniobacterales bacterium]
MVLYLVVGLLVLVAVVFGIGYALPVQTTVYTFDLFEGKTADGLRCAR